MSNDFSHFPGFQQKSHLKRAGVGMESRNNVSFLQTALKIFAKHIKAIRLISALFAGIFFVQWVFRMLN